MLMHVRKPDGNGFGKYPGLSRRAFIKARFQAPSQGHPQWRYAQKHQRITVTALRGNFTQLP